MAATREAAVGLNLIGQPELSEQLMRALELKGDLPQLISPVFGVGMQADDWTLPEYRYLRRMNRFYSAQDVAAVAAQFSYFAFGRNGTSGQNMLAVVEHMILTNNDAGAQGFRIYMCGNVAMPGIGVGAESVMDDRVADLATLRAGFTSGKGNSAADFSAGVPNVVIRLAPTSSILLPLAWVLSGRINVNTAPSQLMVQSAGVNVSFAASVFYRERQLLQAER